MGAHFLAGLHLHREVGSGSAETHQAEPSPCAPRASYSESEVKDYLWQMLSATQYLHAQHILHLDLRSENMIVTEYNLLKVVDLGNAQSLTQERILPSERFRDYVETMGAWGRRWARSQSFPQSCLEASPVPPLSQPQSSWKARVPSHRLTSGPSV